MANYYSWQQIKEKLTCPAYLESRGIKLNSESRCAATWRGGTNPNSVHVETEQYFDHGAKVGGSVIDLCAVVEFNGDTIRAVQELGKRLNLTPTIVSKKDEKSSHYDRLTKDGYKPVASYDYDDETGKLLFTVVRMERHQPGQEKEKTFLQKTPEHWGLEDNTRHVLYNLRAMMAASQVFVCEGEFQFTRS